MHETNKSNFILASARHLHVRPEDVVEQVGAQIGVHPRHDDQADAYEPVSRVPRPPHCVPLLRSDEPKQRLEEGEDEERKAKLAVRPLEARVAQRSERADAPRQNEHQPSDLQRDMDGAGGVEVSSGWYICGRWVHHLEGDGNGARKRGCSKNE